MAFYVLLAAFAIIVVRTATTGAKSADRHSESAERASSEVVWPKKTIGFAMLCVAAAYAYQIYVDDWTRPLAVRGAGWLLLGLGISTRRQRVEGGFLTRLSGAWSNERGSSMILLGALALIGHTVYLILESGITGLRFDYDLVSSVLAQLRQ